MTYFDATLELDPITEQSFDPVLPEERHVFELIGFERSQPDQWRKEGGIKWTWLVFKEDGRTPFIFDDEQYQFFRTTGLDKRTGRPSFSVGTYANDWASALLGRQLGVDAHFSVSELRGKRMSAMVVWEKQRTDPTKKTIKLSSLRHVPVGPLQSPVSAAEQVTADATEDDVDRALLVTKLNKTVERLTKMDAESGKRASDAIAKFDLATCPLEAIQKLQDRAQVSLDKAMDD